MKHTRQIGLRCTAAACLALVSLSAGATTWVVQSLGTLQPPLNGGSQTVNSTGRVPGNTYVVDHYTPVVSGPNGVGITTLAAPANSNSASMGINDAGRVVGWVRIGNANAKAFVTNPDGSGYTVLGTLGGTISLANGINQSGQIVGYASEADEANIYPFITDANAQGMRRIAAPAGFPGGGVATGVNDLGQVTGSFCIDAACSAQHAFVTGANGQNATDLGTLGGDASYALSVNASGQVVGISRVNATDFHGFVTGPNGVGMKDIGTFGGTRSAAYDINTLGQIVGDANAAGSSQTHAFVTGPNGANMVDLNTEVTPPNGGYFMSAKGINDKGQVVAVAGDGIAYLLTPKIATPSCSVTHKVIRKVLNYTTADISVTNLTAQTQNNWAASWQFSEPVRVISAMGGTLNVSSSNVATAKSGTTSTVKAGATEKISYIVSSRSGAPKVSQLQATLAGQACAVTSP
jgi:probable HAF family extracellular repeat protein